MTAATKTDLLQQPVSVLPGIGAKTAGILEEKLSIRCVIDLLFHLPHRYEDRTRLTPIGALSAGMSVLICGTVEFTEMLLKGRKSLICRISDNTGFLSLRFFHFSASQQQQLKPGVKLKCFAEVRYGYAGLEMVHPDYQVLSDNNAIITDDCLTPVYPLVEGLRQSTLRKAVKQALLLAERQPECLPDWIPVSILQQYGYPSLLVALQVLHLPDSSVDMVALQEGRIPALKRLAFEELLTHYAVLRKNRLQSRRWMAPVLQKHPPVIDRFLNNLPFTLTAAQQRAIADVEQDCSKNHPMLRLVQGDVGSGKTIVAAYAALLAISAGFQVAIMAPTELLAEQHYRNFGTWFAGFQTQVVFLSGQLKTGARRDVLSKLAEGSAGIAIGTHALFQESVSFQRLALIVIDEQHRFGVHQRLALRNKGQAAEFRPHQLVMTATPIPRTLAMLNYADLDISIINELPPGRTPVVTSVIPADRRDQVIARIQNWVDQQRQAYWVCTLIEESDVLQCEAAEKTAQYLAENLPHVRIALLHGRMKAAEKDRVMQAFKRHDLDLLVATTVIEVGVDVPNAGLMVIENPERLGLSQLHQLRGRVGRGVGDSYCVLMYQAPLSENSKRRLGVIRDTHDGFVIAEKDLELRGPGELMGVRQTGLAQFKIADLNRDADLVDTVTRVADQCVQDNNEMLEALSMRWLGAATAYAEV